MQRNVLQHVMSLKRFHEEEPQGAPALLSERESAANPIWHRALTKPGDPARMPADSWTILPSTIVSIERIFLISTSGTEK